MAIHIVITSSTGRTLFTFSEFEDDSPNYRTRDDDAIRSVAEAIAGSDWITDVHTEPISISISEDTVRNVPYPAP